MTRTAAAMVGRDDVLALVERRWRAAAAGSGHLLLIAGEAGIGKTRLLREAAARIEAAGARTLTAAAHPRDVDTPGGVLVDVAAALGLSLGGRPREQAAAVLAAATAPTLLIVEDLHWADTLTLDLLDRIAAGADAVPLLVLGSLRSDELYPAAPVRVWRARLLTQRRAEEARLARLDAAQTAAVCAAIGGGPLPAEAVAAIHARSDGIPLHIEEIMAAPGDLAGLPDTLADVVTARLELLGRPARDLAGAASVIGRTFDLDLLVEITGRPPAEIDAGLQELTERFFVAPLRDGRYEFRHALIRDAVYSGLRPLARRELHARTAAAAERAGFAGAFVSAQYEHAHQAAPAHRHALAAARQAAALSAHREAVELYRRAQRTGAAFGPDLLLELAGSLAAIDDNAAAAHCYAAAHTRFTELGDTRAAAAVVPPLVAARHLLGAGLSERTALLRAALADPLDTDLRVRVLAALAAAYMLDRRLDEAREHGRAAAALVREPAVGWNVAATLGVVDVFAGRMASGWALLTGAVADAVAAKAEPEAARAYRMIGSSASVLVEYALAERYLTDGIAYAERAERWNDRHYMAAHLAHVHWCTGDWDAAAREADQALADGRGGITTQITAAHVLGYVALSRGRYADAARHLTTARELAEPMSELQRLSPALWGLAETSLLTGDVLDAIAWCERGYAASAAVSDAAYLFPFVVTGVRAYLRTGDPTAAADWYARTSPLLLQRSIPGTLPALAHASGLLHLAAGRTGKARESLQEARTGWDRHRRHWEATSVRADLASCSPHSGSVLTSREVEIARHVARGSTNKEIAVALHISPKTVAAHVEHILTKLGAGRRTEIAAWAVRHPPS
ncbi:ATP-binding protein [Hamadaea tsunoensis]|uniref:ATP-binding protein n=1 Tax=Hamadaea tsunoensis TaxID=53368 RepID=UPI00146FA987|nr:LuxR C-terminal-related transcriptional regulator [Hamadaea tsunoensis]